MSAADCPRQGWAGLAWLLLGVWLSSAPAWAQADATSTAPPPRISNDEQRLAACAALAASPFPRNAVERRSLLQRLEAARESCIDHAAFLATLGGSWLEDGEPDQALLWLERSLLLEPDQPGAQADHALALMALGNPSARDDLLRKWAGRSDVPPLVWSRLRDGVGAAGSAARGGGPVQRQRWAQVRELAVLAGYESNLDQSPRLTELTLTPSDGPITWPLLEPITPRAGGATVAEVAWQLAFSPQQGTLVQAGVQVTARQAFNHSDTNWHHLQLAASASQRFGGWRAQLQASATWFGGRLNEPYQVQRLTLSLENNGLGCLHRVALEADVRRQRLTSLNDGRARAALWSLLCPLPGLRDWTGGIALRSNVDRPQDELRPGGTQRQHSVGLRISGPVGSLWRADASVRFTQTQDSEGYSPLLENNARRSAQPVQLNLELTRPSNIGLLLGSDIVVQIQHVQQDSNLALFTYKSTALFSGLRWRW